MQQTSNHINAQKQASSRALRIVIAGGGTGGHIFPAIAIANAIRKINPAVECLFIGAKGKMEMEKVPQAGYRIEGLTIAGFNRSSLIKNIGLPFKIIKSFIEVRNIFREFKPHAAVGVGGYSSFPVLRYAQQKNIPTFIHESNSYAGKSNQILAKKATKVFVATDGMEKFFPSQKMIVTGNPVRFAIAHNQIEKGTALQHFGLSDRKSTVLVIGGSLGAKSINEAIAKGLSQIIDNQLQLIWQTGKTTAETYKVLGKNQPNVWVDAFINQMEMAYAAADIVISRSGAMAVTELCVSAKPTIFVPFPFAAEDHQTVNAIHLVQKQAALMVADKEASNKLVDELIALSTNTALQQKLSQNIGQLAMLDADIAIANEILNVIA